MVASPRRPAFVLALGAVIGSIVGGKAAGLDAFETIGLLAILQAAAYTVYLVVLDRLVRRSAAARSTADIGNPT